MSIIDNLRAIRKEHKLSQADVAEILNTTQQQYSKYENGTHEIPIRHITTLCQYYDISSDKLLGLKHSEIKENVDALLAMEYIDKTDFTSYLDFLQLAQKDGKLNFLMKALTPLFIYLLTLEKLGIPSDPKMVEILSASNNFDN